MELVDRIDPGFAHWLAGFIDGEGCFLIVPDRGSFHCVMRLGLRADDEPILQEIRERTGLGTVRWQASMAIWVVSRKADAAAMVTLLDQYPLRAKKARDFAIWREAVSVQANRRRVHPRRGEGHHFARLSDQTVGDIRAAVAAGGSQVEVAGRYGVDQGYVSRVVAGKARGSRREDPARERMRELHAALVAVRKPT